MYNIIKKTVKYLLPKSVFEIGYKTFIEPFKINYKKSYAQCGEDIILDIILNKPKVFYIDIGANNPIKQSNTMYFYNRGGGGYKY